MSAIYHQKYKWPWIQVQLGRRKQDLSRSNCVSWSYLILPYTVLDLHSIMYTPKCTQLPEFTVRTESGNYICLPWSATVSPSFESVFCDIQPLTYAFGLKGCLFLCTLRAVCGLVTVNVKNRVLLLLQTWESYIGNIWNAQNRLRRWCYGENRDLICFLDSNLWKLQLRLWSFRLSLHRFHRQKCEGSSQNCQWRLTKSHFSSHQQVRPLECKMPVNSKG
jgi:hypothetical protein